MLGLSYKFLVFVISVMTGPDKEKKEETVATHKFFFFSFICGTDQNIKKQEIEYWSVIPQIRKEKKKELMVLSCACAFLLLIWLLDTHYICDNVCAAR